MILWSPLGRPIWALKSGTDFYLVFFSIWLWKLFLIWLWNRDIKFVVWYGMIMCQAAFSLISSVSLSACNTHSRVMNNQSEFDRVAWNEHPWISIKQEDNSNGYMPYCIFYFSMGYPHTCPTTDSDNRKLENLMSRTIAE